MVFLVNFVIKMILTMQMIFMGYIMLRILQMNQQSPATIFIISFDKKWFDTKFHNNNISNNTNNNKKFHNSCMSLTYYVMTSYYIPTNTFETIPLFEQSLLHCISLKSECSVIHHQQQTSLKIK